MRVSRPVYSLAVSASLHLVVTCQTASLSLSTALLQLLKSISFSLACQPACLYTIALVCSILLVDASPAGNDHLQLEGGGDLALPSEDALYEVIA